ncbi:META domain-containing protein [uncultured Draconibacterium sp.]|uniref:META domain-containing protein n=1 Tax=uncultured Draconibacterium sp. TaxID=1573823 RepID=UPI003217424D
MKNSISLLAIYVVIALFVSCSNDNDCNCSEDIYGKWEVKEFMSVESALYAKNYDYNPVIEFKNNGTYLLQLDRNNCLGEFEFDGSDNGTITGASCTKVCCDSDFSIKFGAMLGQVSSFEIDGDELKLHVSGWGWIVLERISD